MKQMEYFGYGSIKELSGILRENKVDGIFLVAGGNSYVLSGAKKVIDQILKPYKVTIFSNFTPNPKLEDVENGVRLFRKSNCDIVIAVGGGSAIDMAKSINCFAAQSFKPLDYFHKKGTLRNQGKPLIAIPTTAGTGSEATKFAVIYIGKEKHSLEHNELILPKYAIIDPQLTMNLPPKITASTGVDALTQAIESYWSINSTEKSKYFASKAIRLVLDNLTRAVKKYDKISRVAMAKAANLSGKAINISKTTASHAISYPITSYFGVPHGHAVSLTIGSMFVFNYGVTEEDCLDKRGADYVKRTMNELMHLFGVIKPSDAKAKIEILMGDIGLTTKLINLHISSDADIELIVKNGFNPDRVRNNPRKLNADQLTHILENLR